MRATIVYFVFICFSWVLSSQNFDKEIDSLKSSLNENRETETHIDAAIRLGKIYNRSNIDSAFVYFKQAIAMSESKNILAKRVESYSSIAASYIIKGKFDSAHYYFNQSEKLLDNISDYTLISSFYGDKGILHYYEGDIKQAAINFNRALQVSKENNDWASIIKYSNNTALAYSQLGNSAEAIEIYYGALKLAEEHNDVDQIGKLLNNIGLVYENMSQFEEALDFYKKAFAVKKKSATQIDIANAYYNMANMQLKLAEANSDSKMLETAKENFNQTLKISNENEYGTGKLYGLEGLGQIAFSQKEYSRAKAIYTKMDSLSRAYKNTPLIGVSNLKLGELATQEGRYQESISKLNIAKEIIEASDVKKDQAQLYHALNQYYLKTANFKEAHRYLKQQKEIEEALSSKNLQDKISNYEIKYETEKKENEILAQKATIAENKLNINRKNTQLIGLVVLAVVLSLLGYLLFKQQKLKNEQLQKESQLKEALVKIETQNKLQEQRLRISRDLHDNIGAQLTFIISSIENLQYGFKITNEKLTDKLLGISNFTKETISELRDTIWAMNKNAITLEDLQARISNFIDKAQLSSSGIKFEFNVDPNIEKEVEFTSVRGMNIYRIIQEAVNNALKYAEPSLISVDIKNTDEKIQFKVTDNGTGFEKEQVETGNGLANMKKRADEIDAHFEIESKPGTGTVVTLVC